MLLLLHRWLLDCEHCHDNRTNKAQERCRSHHLHLAALRLARLIIFQTQLLILVRWVGLRPRPFTIRRREQEVIESELVAAAAAVTLAIITL